MRKKMFLGASHLIFENAKELRKNLTYSEMLLWGYLKTKPLDCKFRRQHPLGIYIADFYCHPLKLVIEVDGSIHDVEEIKENDRRRELILESDGLSILRFTNEQVDRDLQGVIKSIETKLLTLKNEKPL